MNSNICIVFIILIFIILYLSDFNNYIILLVLVSTIFISYLFNNELFTNYSLSKYDNISMSEDVDMSKQDVYGLQGGNNLNNQIDNADVIELAITRGTSLFQPQPKNGFTSLKGLIDGNDNLYGYTIPLTGQQDVDELLARKQAQRGIMNKRSLDGAVRSTKKIFVKYLTDELAENEKRVWWSSEAQDLETDWNPY